MVFSFDVRATGNCDRSAVSATVAASSDEFLESGRSESLLRGAGVSLDRSSPLVTLLQLCNNGRDNIHRKGSRLPQEEVRLVGWRKVQLARKDEADIVVVRCARSHWLCWPTIHSSARPSPSLHPPCCRSFRALGRQEIQGCRQVEAVIAHVQAAGRAGGEKVYPRGVRRLRHGLFWSGQRRRRRCRDGLPQV